MHSHKLGVLITAQRLAKAISGISTKQLRVLDGTSIENYKDGHIPGAVLFDSDICKDVQSPYSVMLPSASQFEHYVGELGIRNDTHVVVYDDHEDYAVYSAPRVWWMFRVFGHDSVSVLNGGLKLWKDANYPVDCDEVTIQKQKFKAKFRPNLVTHFENIESNINSRKFQVVDARSSERFHGNEPEGSDEMKPGHIPGTVSLPYTSMMAAYRSARMDKERGRMMEVTDMKRVFADANIDLNKPLVATCGTGVTACTLAMAAYMCGKKDVSVYDGSWMEWYLRS